MMLLLLFDVLAYDRVAARYAFAELERIVASKVAENKSSRIQDGVFKIARSSCLRAW